MSASDRPLSSEKIIHMAKDVAPNGNVSALCFSRPRAIDLARASWTNRPYAVTCKKCIAMFKQAKPA